MSIQTIELAGRRFVVLPEEDFKELQKLAGATEPGGSVSVPKSNGKPRFTPFAAIKVSGIPASEMLLQDRR